MAILNALRYGQWPQGIVPVHFDEILDLHRVSLDSQHAANETRYRRHIKKNQTSKEVVRTEHVYGIGFTATASVETANVESVFIMKEGGHVDMTGLWGIG